jgi:hypothetical protein
MPEANPDTARLDARLLALLAELPMLVIVPVAIIFIFLFLSYLSFDKPRHDLSH